MRHSSIIPLIGGMTIGAIQATGRNPEGMFSYPQFEGNDKYIRQYLGMEIQDIRNEPLAKQVDIVHSVCPCAGLSSASTRAGANNPTNLWMLKSSEWALAELKPRVLVGENAPRLYGPSAEPFVNKMREIGQKYGYTLQIIKTKTCWHGGVQTRERSFFFFWKGDVCYRFDGTRNEIGMSWIEYLRSFPDFDNDGTIGHVLEYYPMINLGRHYFNETSLQIFDRMRALKGGRGGTALDFVHHYGLFDAADEYFPQRHFFEGIGPGWNDYIFKQQKGAHKLIKRSREKNILDTTPKAMDVHYFPAMMWRTAWTIVVPGTVRSLTVKERNRMMMMPEDFPLPLDNENAICQSVPVTTAKWAIQEAMACIEGEREAIKTSHLHQNISNGQIYWEDPEPVEEFDSVPESGELSNLVGLSN